MRASSPGTLTTAVERRSREEAPTAQWYSPPSTTQRPSRVSQYARSARSMLSTTSAVWPAAIATLANALSSRGERRTAEPGRLT